MDIPVEIQIVGIAARVLVHARTLFPLSAALLHTACRLPKPSTSLISSSAIEERDHGLGDRG
jgi:hypothetical protein